MLLNESLHQYVPTFNGLKQGNAAFAKASLLVALVWVTFSHGYTFVGACFEGLGFFCIKWLKYWGGVGT
jgi:hypothetical protein